MGILIFIIIATTVYNIIIITLVGNFMSSASDTDVAIGLLLMISLIVSDFFIIRFIKERLWL